MIEVSEKYAIGSDKLNWIIYKKIKPNKRVPSGWEAQHYYGNLGQAVKSLKDLMLRVSDYNSVAELITASTAISELFDKELFNEESK